MKQKTTDKIKTTLIALFATAVTSTAFCSALREFSDDYVMPREFASASWDSTNVHGVGDVYRQYVVQQFNAGAKHLRWDDYLNAIFEKNHLQEKEENQLSGKILLPYFRVRRGN